MKFFEGYVCFDSHEEFIENIKDIQDHGLDYLHEGKRFFILSQSEFNRVSSKGVKTHQYLLTFTARPEVTYTDFENSMKRQLTRKFFTLKDHVVEHLDSNFHCHVHLETKYPINVKDRFASYIKKIGYVDSRRVYTDNGISGYFSKDSASKKIL